jgi:NAD(P)H dehydrogenase (quinone)
MRALVLYAHPVETSFVAAAHRVAVAALRAKGHEVDDCDLYAEGFDPVLSRQERIDYHDAAINRAPVAAFVERVLRAEALVFIFPVWNFGFPAILKGMLDRVFLPGVSFELSGGRLYPTLRGIRRLTAVCSYGSPRWGALMMGDPPRKLVKRVLRTQVAPLARCSYLACYDMNRFERSRGEAFLTKVERHFAAWG